MRGRRWLAPAALLALAGVLLWGIPSPCPIRFAFGIPCPSCGLTRAARAALSLDFAAATHAHPLWFVVLPALAIYLAVELASFVLTGHSRGLDRRRGIRIAFGAIMVLLVCVWIARFFGAFGGPAPV